MARHVVVMARAPVAGRVKRRLARDIGVVRATWFYRKLSAHIIARLAQSALWTTWVAVTPDRGGGAFRLSRRSLRQQTVIPQGGGDLGARMERLFLRLASRPVILVGSDIPEISERRIKDAFAALRGRDAVFGPAEDGGYWLVGLRRPRLARGLFAGVRWSSEHALVDTLKNLRSGKVALTATLGDVDDGASFARLAIHGVRLTPPAAGRRGRRVTAQPGK